MDGPTEFRFGQESNMSVLVRAQARRLVEACFKTEDVLEDGPRVKRRWSCRFCLQFQNKVIDGHQRALHHIMGCSEKGTAGKATACYGPKLPTATRNNLRALYGLGPFVATATAGKQNAAQQPPAQTTESELNKELAMVFYECNLPFALADHPRLRRFLETLAKSNVPGYSPLTARQIGAEARIVAAEEDSNHPKTKMHKLQSCNTTHLTFSCRL